MRRRARTNILVVNGRVFSVILLPTADCNVACDYCFEHKEPHRLSLLLVPLLTRQLLDHLEHEGIEECEIYWQGGEAMIMGPAWFVEAGEIMDEPPPRADAASRTISRRISSATRPPGMTSCARCSTARSARRWTIPNLHRKLFKGGAEAYTRSGPNDSAKRQAAGHRDRRHRRAPPRQPRRRPRRFLPLLHRGTRPRQTSRSTRLFPAVPAKAVEGRIRSRSSALAEFLAGLFDIWMERGYEAGVSLGPFDALIHHFTGAPARLPCIWKENCSNQFISVDSKGTVAQCDCWVTSYPESFFGNVFREPDLTQMLRTSPARREFVERPKHLVEHEDCL